MIDYLCVDSITLETYDQIYLLVAYVTFCTLYILFIYNQEHFF